MRLSTLGAVAVVLTLGIAPGARAQQADPRQILAAVIAQLQTGTPNPGWYGPQLWSTIAAQTGNSGVYPQLVSLGPVSNVTVTNQIQLPAGPVYQMRANHQNGDSMWLLGISFYSNRIEYANFEVGAAAPAPLPPSPLPVPGPTTPPSPQPTTPDADGSDACKQFPNLC